MQILTIQKGFEEFEYIFEPFKRDSKHSNSNGKHLKGIQNIRIQIRSIQMQVQQFERNSIHSNENFNH